VYLELKMIFSFIRSFKSIQLSNHYYGLIIPITVMVARFC